MLTTVRACDFRVRLDRQDACYAPGEPVTGELTVVVREAVSCRRLRLGWFWQARSESPISSGFAGTLDLPGGQWPVGETITRRFSFAAPFSPATYQGSLLSIDWLLAAEADVAWAVDPRMEAPLPFTVMALAPAPGTPYRGEGSGGSVRQVEGSTLRPLQDPSMESVELSVRPGRVRAEQAVQLVLEVFTSTNLGELGGTVKLEVLEAIAVHLRPASPTWGVGETIVRDSADFGSGEDYNHHLEKRLFTQPLELTLSVQPVFDGRSRVLASASVLLPADLPDSLDAHPHLIVWRLRYDLHLAPRIDLRLNVPFTVVRVS
jgi:hypothetical protein